MERKPLVGICIPAFNRLELLKRAVKSVLGQDYDNYLLIISDDSKSKDIYKWLIEQNNSKIIYNHNENSLGAAGNTSKAIEVAIENKVDYIKILYQDDWFVTDMALTKMVEYIRDTKADVLFSANLEVYKDCETKHVCTPEGISEIERDLSVLFRGNRLGAPSNLMYKVTDIFLDESYTWLLDTDFYLRLLPNRKMVYLYEPLIAIGHDGEQLTDYFLKHPYKMLIEKVRQYMKYDWLHTKINRVYLIKSLYHCIRASFKMDKKCMK